MFLHGGLPSGHDGPVANAGRGARFRVSAGLARAGALLIGTILWRGRFLRHAASRSERPALAAGN
jgi:hypothetical protein